MLKLPPTGGVEFSNSTTTSTICVPAGSFGLDTLNVKTPDPSGSISMFVCANSFCTAAANATVGTPIKRTNTDTIIAMLLCISCFIDLHLIVFI